MRFPEHKYAGHPTENKEDCPWCQGAIEDKQNKQHKEIVDRLDEIINLLKRKLKADYDKE